MKRLKIILYIVMLVMTSHHVMARKKAPKTYDSYRGLVMAGYQGWFTAEGDGASRGFYHYKGRDGFKPGSTSVDMWPDVSEYSQTYPTAFTMPDGSVAKVFSSNDSSTVAKHFEWMRKYGLDGVFMQRFVSEIKDKSGKSHFDKVLSNAMTAANNNERAICVMYDLSGMHGGDENFVLNDMDELAQRHSIFDRSKNPSYLYQNGKPLVSVWGVGFNDRRAYDLDNCIALIDGLRARGYSVMIGVPTYWRELGADTEDDARLHELISRCDVVMPWFVGRYDSEGYGNFSKLIPADIEWCEERGLEYAPLVFPGFSWKNMKGKDSLEIPRDNGAFMEKQINGAIGYGAKSLYVAMFDEIDEGTAIFKCAKVVPVAEGGTEFVAIDPKLKSDHYLKMVGRAGKKIRKNAAGDKKLKTAN